MQQLRRNFIRFYDGHYDERHEETLYRAGGMKKILHSYLVVYVGGFLENAKRGNFNLKSLPTSASLVYHFFTTEIKNLRHTHTHSVIDIYTISLFPLITK